VTSKKPKLKVNLVNKEKHTVHLLKPGAPQKKNQAKRPQKIILFNNSIVCSSQRKQGCNLFKPVLKRTRLCSEDQTAHFRLQEAFLPVSLSSLPEK
jgi:hypothetical protein